LLWRPPCGIGRSRARLGHNRTLPRPASSRDGLVARTFGQSRSPSEQDLHDYVDGRLDDAGRARIEAHLKRHAGDRAKVAAWRTIASGLHALYDHTLDEPVPEAMRKLLRKKRG
jgi:hypothetical protein